jgi:transcriptional regulator with XRE-family HTH domain
VGTKQAVVDRIQSLCAQKGIAINSLANLSGLTPSTVYSLMDSRRKDVGILTIKKLCDGLGVTLGEFFSTEEFDRLEQEIK